MTVLCPLQDKLVVGITSRALFDLDAEGEVFRTEGLDAYRRHQRQREALDGRACRGGPKG